MQKEREKEKGIWKGRRWRVNKCRKPHRRRDKVKRLIAKDDRKRKEWEKRGGENNFKG